MGKYLTWLMVILTATTAAVLSSCSGFQAVSPQNNDQILFNVNDSAATLSAGTLRITPLPLPRVAPGADQPKPLTLPPDSKSQRVVPPYSGTGESSLSIPDGQVELADLTTAPYQSGGRLTFRFPSDAPGTGHACTSQFIGSQGVLLTAAHCVWDQPTRAWANSILFDLQYDSGVYTQAFDWQCAAIVSGWTNGLYPYDYAFIKVRGVAPTGLGLEINTGPAHVDAIGYPINYYNNQRMVHVFGNKDGNNPSAMPNTMSHGASGGAWIDNGSAASVNSFKYTNDDSTMHGPVLSPTTQALYNFVAGSCKAQVRTMGSMSAASIAYAEKEDAETVMTPATEELQVGARVSFAEDSQCSCGDKAEATLENTTDESRIVGIQHIATDGNRAHTSGSQDYYALNANERKPLGCLRSSSGNGRMCSIDNQFRIVSDRRADGSAPILPSADNKVPLAASFAGQDASRCVAACASGDLNKCLPLGQGSIPILAPLAKFIQQVNGAAAKPDGLLVAKKDVVAEYGGDPATAKDPCDRGDIERNSDSITNAGLACYIRTKSLFPQETFRTRLSMRSNVRGYPSAWSPALRSLTPGITPTLFPDQQTSPAIDFEGANAAGLNKKFGGDVYAVTAASDKEIIVSTSNGCIQGPYRK